MEIGPDCAEKYLSRIAPRSFSPPHILEYLGFADDRRHGARLSGSEDSAWKIRGKYKFKKVRKVVDS